MANQKRYIIQKSIRTEPQSGRQVAVIGGGITGLSAGWALKRRGADVLVLESQDRPGGAVQTVAKSGYLAECGPNTLQVNALEHILLLGELGLGESLQLPTPAARNRYIVKAGELLPAPDGPAALLRSPLFRTSAKLRLLKEPFIKPSPESEEISLASFVQRRLGSEPLQWAVDPFVSGIYAGDAQQLSVKHAFETLYRLEQEGGSLFRGALKSMKARKASGRYRPKAFLASFPSGLDALPQAFARHLEASLHCGCSLNRIQKTDTGWQLQWHDGTLGKAVTRVFDAVVVACPVPAMVALPFEDGIASALQPLADIVHPPLASWVLGFPREAVRHALDGFGALVPSCENRDLLGVLFNSTLFPGRAPEGHVTMTAFIGGLRKPDLARLPQAEQRERVLKGLDALLGISAEPSFEHRTYWEHSIPQYNIGYGRYLELADRVETEHPGLHLAGNWRGGIALGNCLSNGLELGRQLASVES